MRSLKLCLSCQLSKKLQTGVSEPPRPISLWRSLLSEPTFVCTVSIEVSCNLENTKREIPRCLKKKDESLDIKGTQQSLLYNKRRGDSKITLFLKMLTWQFLFETGCTLWWHKMNLLVVAMYPVAQVQFDCCHDLFSSLFKFLLCFNHHYWVKKEGV